MSEGHGNLSLDSSASPRPAQCVLLATGHCFEASSCEVFSVAGPGQLMEVHIDTGLHPIAQSSQDRITLILREEMYSA